MPLTVRGVLFDLDGTLFDREAAIRHLLHDQHGRFGAALGGVARTAFVERLLELDAHGQGDKTLAYRLAATELVFPGSLADALTADFWSRYHDECRSFPDVMPALRELHRRGLCLGIVTNGRAAIQQTTIDCLGLTDLMHTVHISECEGVRKPHREIFDRALRALGLSANEVWYVGDHPEIDVRGATEAGLAAVWRRTSHWPEPGVPHRCIDRLGELIPLIDDVDHGGRRHDLL